MAFETWSPGLNGAGIVGSGALAGVNYGAKPPSDDKGDWTITGYRTVRTPRVGKAAEGGTHSERQVPIWGRMLGGSAAAPPKSAEPEAPREEPKLNTELIAAAKEKADAVRAGSLAAPAPEAVKLGAGELYDNIYNLGTKGLQDYERSMQERRARNIEANAETITGINYALKLLDPDIQPTKPTDPWAIYERLKGDITA